ncbi:MAG: Hpt domain-containing protein [Gallionella sp.]|nr:Hpt domain-containing protein [Gallionella sp.]
MTIRLNLNHHLAGHFGSTTVNIATLINFRICQSFWIERHILLTGIPYMSSIDSDTFQQMLLQLRNAFLDEVPEKLDRLEQLLIAMENSGVNNDSFNEFYRIIHSLKGSGGTFGLHIITTICHQLEDLLNTTGGGSKFSPPLIAISLNYIDLLRSVIVKVHAGDTNYQQIEEQLNKLHKQLARKPFTVLLVDNSKLSTNIYLQILSELPVQTVVISDGILALTRALMEPFDLVITSNEIPMLSGPALIGALKLSDSKSRDTKTILITSNKNIATTRHRATDADYTLIKDAKLAQNLADAVKQALSHDSSPKKAG